MRAKSSSGGKKALQVTEYTYQHLFLLTGFHLEKFKFAQTKLSRMAVSLVFLCPTDKGLNNN
jgi:hypothetical protein